MRSLVVVSLLAVSTLAHPGFRLLIPNGINVPNPCINVVGLWNAVGHNIEIGGGPGNVFGMVRMFTYCYKYMYTYSVERRLGK